MRSVDVLVPKMPDQWPSACPQTSFAVPTWARQRGTWAVTYMREMRPDELRGSAGTYRLREELIARANTAAAPAKVSDVLFTQMLIQ